MLVPICEDCYKKIIATKVRINTLAFPFQGPDISVKEYRKLFQMYLLGTCCDDIATEKKNKLFVYGLSDENKEEVNKLAFLDARLKTEDFIEHTVSYLLAIEDFKNIVLGKKDLRPVGNEHMDV